MIPVSIAPIIYPALTAHEELTAIVGSRIYDTVVTQGVEQYPWVLMRCQLTRVEYDMEHNVCEDTHTIDVQCASQVSMAETYSIATCVREALEGKGFESAVYTIDCIELDSTESAYDINYQAFVTTLHFTATCQPNENV